MRRIGTLGIVGLVSLALAGCGSAGATPSPATVPPLVTCILRAGDGTFLPPKPLPASLPASLPVDLVPADAAIYALRYPQAWDQAPDALWMVGPAGGTCTGEGAGPWAIVRDANDDPFLFYEVPWSADPSQFLSCPYIAAARTAAAAVSGGLDPSQCVPAEGERVVGIPTGVKNAFMAVVLSDGEDRDATASVYTFVQDTDDALGTSSRATCSIEGSLGPTCLAALAFLFGESPAVDAAIGAAMGVPTAPER